MSNGIGIKQLCEAISKRVHPETEKEKNCINEFGKLVIKRGHFTKELINFISKYDGKAKADILEQGKE